ncbi:MAG: uracil-DNA glycosylase [Deltaproteobacteria bacterium]|nr:MAG: uracil-DNA glycosylase [Deltaproteobacteria bacterium]
MPPNPACVHERGARRPAAGGTAGKESTVARSDAQSKTDDAQALARAYLQRECELGLSAVPRVARQKAAGSSPVTGAPSAERPEVRELSDLLVDADVRGAKDLDALREVIGDCRRCKLSGGRTNIVFGVGNPAAELMFVGEGPGEEEDRQGLPFVGRAGALLTDIIEKGMGLRRKDVYIANVVKCRPPGNRNPQPDEIVACEPFLHRQIALIRPRVIVTLGTFATQVLLKNRTPISKQRGRWTEYQGVPVMPTFHPAYLLRNPGDKRTVWEDIKLVMAHLGLKPPARARR